MKQQIKISIADRVFGLSVQADKEEMFRKAVKMINETVDMYKAKFANRDIQDALSMAILKFATIIVDYEQKDEAGNLLNELKLLDKQLEEYIQSSDR